MEGRTDNNSLPSSQEVNESLRDPTALVKLGDTAIDHVMGNKNKYDSKWVERLWIAVGSLKDAVDSRVRTNTAAVELALVLLKPTQATRQLSRAEVADLEEPTEEQVEAWAWATDLAKTTRWFVAFVVLGILALLAFAVVTFGLESPGSTQTIIFLSLGSGILATATLILGAGLYQHYVVRGYLSWQYQWYPDAKVKRGNNFYKMGGWYAYTIGGVFLALSIAFAIIAGKQLPFSIIPDYTNVRLALLASLVLGFILFALGAWPIVRNVVFRAERDRRMGKAKYMASPRLVLTLLPILIGTLSLLINWLFS